MVGALSMEKLGAVLPTSERQPWWEVEPQVTYRKSMPVPDQPEKAVSLLAIVKNAIGKDLMSLPLPVELHEPMTDLQKICENCEYSELLDQALKKPKHSLERHLLVAAFAAAPYSAAKRTRKAVYALQGETFEAVMPAKKVRFLAEQVNRTPDIAIARMEGHGWLVEIDAEPKPQLLPYAVDIHLNWDLRLTFEDGDVYAWGTLITSVNSLTVVKDMYMTHTGCLHVANSQTDRIACIQFGEPGSRMVNSANTRQANNIRLSGYVSEKGKKLPSPAITGRWDDSITASMPDGSDWIIWRVNPYPPGPSRFGFTYFGTTLNDLPAALEKKLPRTDSRFRPDSRALEQGKNAEATAEKDRLEGRHHAMLSEAKASGKRPVGEAFPPRWFTKVDKAPAKGKDGKFGAVRYQYKGGYWEARKAGKLSEVPPLFDDSPIKARA